MDEAWRQIFQGTENERLRKAIQTEVDFLERSADRWAASTVSFAAIQVVRESSRRLREALRASGCQDGGGDE